MLFNLIAIGKNMPDWVQQGFNEYSKRLPHPYRLQLTEIAPRKRLKNSNIQQLIDWEGEQLLAAITPRQQIIALDSRGQNWSTEQLATQLLDWQTNSTGVALLVGGPDGLAKPCLQRANAVWSLSALTLPHPLVRVIIAEQLYRAWSILHHHPYHR